MEDQRDPGRGSLCARITKLFFCVWANYESQPDLPGGMLTFQSNTRISHPSGKQSLWQHFEKGGTFRLKKKSSESSRCLKYSILASQMSTIQLEPAGNSLVLYATATSRPQTNGRFSVYICKVSRFSWNLSSPAAKQGCKENQKKTKKNKRQWHL